MKNLHRKVGLMLISFILGGILGLTSVHAATSVVLTPTEEYTNTGNVHDILITEDSIWAATDGGLVAYDKTRLRETHRLTSKDGLFGNALRSLHAKSNTAITVGGDFGSANITFKADGKATVSDVERHHLTTFDPIVDFLTIEEQVYALHFQTGLVAMSGKRMELPVAHRLFWNTGAVNGGLVALGAADGTVVVYDVSRKMVAYTLQFVSPTIKLVPYKNGFIVATQTELYTVQNGIAHPLRLSAGNQSVAILATGLANVSADHVLLGTADGMLLRLKDGTVQREAQFAGERVTTIEPEGNQIWLGISQKGLVRYSLFDNTTVYLRNESEICSNHVTQSLYHGDTLVIRTFDSGVCYLSKQGWKQLQAGKSQYVHGLASDGKTLVVTDSDGITLYDEQLQPVEESRYIVGPMHWLSRSAALSAVSPKRGLFFIASPFGIAKLQRMNDRFKTTFWKKKRGIPGDITSLAADDSFLYIGTESRGVRVFSHKGKFITDYLDPTHLPEAWTMTLSTSEKGLFVGTCQEGVAEIDNNQKVTFYNAHTGLADNRIIAVATFYSGTFVGGLHGLSYIDGAGNSVHFEHMAAPDPRSASIYVHNQTMWYGTESGLISYRVSNN
ncbi:MAG: hypothetical protein JXX29_01315 [Deltaproteobacteria bacterium]|nr:hypothetical protein [Deltaproteobacteria bacterium]MBN2670278.1 hypothetical protein [Deltaproteobacteria bacterium]